MVAHNATRLKPCSAPHLAGLALLNSTTTKKLMQSKWLLFVGDSSLRMAYHLLISSLTLGWTAWPRGLPPKGPGSEQSCLNTYNAFSRAHDKLLMQGCMADTPLPALNARVTMVWVDLGDDPAALTPLRALLNSTQSRPHAVVLGMGAWHAMWKPQSDAFVFSLSRTMSSLESLFAPQLHNGATQLVFAGLTHCRNDSAAAEEMHKRVEQYNHLARVIGMSHRKSWLSLAHAPFTAGSAYGARSAYVSGGWRYVNRLHFTECERCEFGDFHPTGSALNRILMTLLACSFSPRVSSSQCEHL
uniref:Uncharacterized protein n=1 Tax=Chrysotila carterae TaxID=13221 RepID=A0A7S4B228_CHRCT